MMRRSRHLAIAITPFVLGMAAPSARADTPPATPEQAHQLEVQTRAWLALMLGATVKLPDRPVIFAPHGDHYQVELPLSVVPGYDKDAKELLDVRDGGDGKWLLSNLVVPSPLHYHDTIKTPTGDQTVDMTITIANQTYAGLIDTSRAGPSTMTGSFSGMDVKGHAGEGDFTGRIDQIDSKGVLQPAGDKTNAQITGDAHDVSFHEPMPDGSTVEFAAQLLHVVEKADGVAGAHLPDVVQAFVALGEASNKHKPVKKIADPQKGPAKPGDTSPEERRAEHQLILALRDFVSGGSLEESVEGLRVGGAGQIVSADRASFGFGASNEAGDLSAYFAIGLDGLKVPNLPLPGMDALLPSKFAMRPVVHGISIETLTNMALDQTSEPPKPTMKEVGALMDHGFDAGLESLDLQVGPASLSGHGMVHVAGGTYEGHAEVTAKGLDDLIEQVKSVPQAAQAVPVLLVAKGMGKIEGDHLLWVIEYKDGQAKVNGLDMAQMMGQGGGGGGAPGSDDGDKKDTPQ